MLWESCHTKSKVVVFLQTAGFMCIFGELSFSSLFSSHQLSPKLQVKSFSGAHTVRFFLETFGPLCSPQQQTSNYPAVPFHHFTDQVGGFLCVCVCVRARRQGVGWSRRRDARIGKDAPLVYWTRNRLGACNRLSKPGDFAFFSTDGRQEGPR